MTARNNTPTEKVYGNDSHLRKTRRKKEVEHKRYQYNFYGVRDKNLVKKKAVKALRV